jgi:hypothetical protein
MKLLQIKECEDPHMWYADKVGEFVPYVRTHNDCYMSREPAGYLNIVKLQEAEIVELEKIHERNSNR